MGSTFYRPPRARGLLATTLVVLLLSATVTVLGPTAPAHAACGSWSKVVSYDYAYAGDYRMAYAQAKQGVGCYDGNVRYASAANYHRGQWLSNGGTWYWSTVGEKLIGSGTQSPVVEMIAGPITVGRLLRIGVDDYIVRWGIWWF